MDEIEFRVVSEDAVSGTSRLGFYAQTDPLVSDLWHLENRGQDGFSNQRPDQGTQLVDLNVVQVHSVYIEGQGVNIAIVMMVLSPNTRTFKKTMLMESICRW